MSTLTAPTLPAYNHYHRLCLTAAQHTALLAALTGLCLLRERTALPHGDWIPWVEAHCEFSRRTASSYLGAAERAIAQLYPGVPVEEIDPQAAWDDLARLIETDHLAEQRAAVIAAIRPVPTRAELPPVAQKKPRAPRKPQGLRPITAQAAPVLVNRLRIATPEVRAALFTDLRPEIEEWLRLNP